MSGRVTFLHGGWEPAEGGWIQPIAIPGGALARMELALSRKLSPAEISTIANELAFYQHIKNNLHEPKRQDVKETLEKIVKLSPREAQGAYLKCDETTRALIDEALFDLELLDIRRGVYQPGESVIQAAGTALGNMQSHKGGRPSKPYQTLLIDYAARLWPSLGGTSCKAWERDGIETPIVTFTCALASIVDGENMDSSRAVKLLRPRLT